MKRKSGEEMVKKALEFMRKNVSKPLTVGQVARSTGYSYPYFYEVFKEVTGQGPKHHLLRMRLERARELLGGTDRNVTDVAAAGFGSYISFNQTFRRKTGMSPREYRTRARSSGVAVGTPRGETGSQECFRDDFRGSRMGPHWRVQNGEWKQEDGSALGRGETDVAIQFVRPLPENFRISLEARLISVAGQDSYPLRFMLKSDVEKTELYEFAVGAFENTMGLLSRNRTPWRMSPRGSGRPGKWQKLDAQLMEDTLTFTLNGEEIFSFRDPFPPPYARRCNFQIGCWSGSVRVRALRIYDLGFSTLVRAVRQGDALYNAGTYDRALDFYTRLLREGRSFIDAVELRYKIGMCHLRLRDSEQAIGWMEKVVSVPEGDFWPRQARVAMLEASATDDVDAYIKRARALWEDPATRDDALRLLRLRIGALGWKGFWTRREPVARLLAELETGGPFRAEAFTSLADTLVEMGRFDEAAAIYLSVLAVIRGLITMSG